MMTEAKAEEFFLGSLVIGENALMNDSALLKDLRCIINADVDSHEAGCDMALNMAQTARQLLGTDLGLGVAPMLSDGNSENATRKQDAVYVGIASDKGTKVSRSSFARGRVHANERAALFALVEMAGWLKSNYAAAPV